MSATVKVNAHQSGPSALIPNSGQKPWVVQKFGGTSIGKFAVNIAEEIVRYVWVCGFGSWELGGRQRLIGNRAGLRDNRIAVVCSARSTGKKVEGTTSR